jgi:hypothetical protein
VHNFTSVLFIEPCTERHWRECETTHDYTYSCGCPGPGSWGWIQFDYSVRQFRAEQLQHQRGWAINSNESIAEFLIPSGNFTLNQIVIALSRNGINSNIPDAATITVRTGNPIAPTLSPLGGTLLETFNASRLPMFDTPQDVSAPLVLTSSHGRVAAIEKFG